MARKPSKPARRQSVAETRPPGGIPASQPKPERKTAPLLDRIRWDWLAAAVSLLLLAWLVTGGDWDFFPKPGYLESFYDAQARSLVHGRIDVPPEAIGNEAFLRNGKAYSYFGPTPALARLPLNLLLPGMYGRWSRLSMLLASVLTVGMLFPLMRALESRFPLAAGPRLRNALRAALILAAAIGSTSFYLTAERRPYQESIIWASALAFAQAVLLARYLLSPKSKWLALSCIAALLAFLARVSTGAGPLVSLALLGAMAILPSVRFREFFTGSAIARRAALPVGATLVAAAMLWAGLNYWKFGTVFTSLPIAMHVQYNHDRVQRIKGDLFSLYNLPLTLPAYLSPANVEFHKGFPWVYLTMGDPALGSRFPKAHFDVVEPFAGLPAAMPELFLAALAGLGLTLARRQALREFRAPMCGALAGCFLMFTWGLITYRYLHDLFPWLLLGSAVAVANLPAIPRKGLRWGLAGLFAAATLYAMCVNCAFAVRLQRYTVHPVRPETRAEFAELSAAIDTGGLQGFLWFTGHWHRYIPAASFHDGNLSIDRTTQLAERDDLPVVLSNGQPPYGAEYDVDLPADGTYAIALRYAAAEPRPVHLFVDGRDVNVICTTPTGGWLPSNQMWVPAGHFRLGAGANRIGLASYSPFPPISMIRVIRLD
jgi:hypothetical protein